MSKKFIYIVVCEYEVFWVDDKLKGCKEYIKNTFKKYPNHKDLKIYKAV